jgi:cell division protein YceG involved in septum cleavage
MKVLGMGHTYELDNVESGIQTLQFIRKEEKDGKLETMINGTTNEQVIAVLIDRTKFLDEKNPSDFNKDAIQNLEAALLAFQNRTADRESRGVEGTVQA